MIGGLIIAFLIWALFGDKIKNGIKIIIAIIIFIMLLGVIFSNPGIGIPMIAILAFIVWNELHKEKKAIKKWKQKACNPITEYEIDDLLGPCIQELKEKDSNKSDYKFNSENMPYGRLTAFLNYYGIERDTDAYYFSAICSKQEDELREYGIVIIRQGILFSRQIEDSSSENGIRCKDSFFKFSGLRKVIREENKLSLQYIAKDKDQYDYIHFPTNKLTMNVDSIVSLFQVAIDQNIAEAAYKGIIITENELQEKLDLAQEEFLKKRKVRDMQKGIDTSSIIAGSESRQAIYDEVGNYMNGKHGAGYAAEYGNNTVDRLLGKKVENVAQQLDENNRQAKFGADRNVKGINIQTKYCKTANESIGAAFENKKAVYLNSDGTMMQIEVPRDQYTKACEVMQKRIDSGQVPGVKPGEDARKFVRKGFFSYEASFNIASAGTIEGLTVDAINGVMTCSIPAGISVILVFSMAIWNGQKPVDAAKAGIITGVKVLGKGTLIFTLTEQFSRKDIAIPFTKVYSADGVSQGAKTMINPAFSLTEKLATSINTSSLAKTNLGKSMKLDTVSGKAITSNAIVAVAVFGPDICRAARGRISKQQLFKNSAVGACGIGGSLLGSALIPIPIVGAIAGGMVSSFIAKNVLDAFVEDDAKQMFQILKEEFLDLVMESNLLKDELDVVLNETLINKNLSKMLEDMYMSNEFRKFAREAIVRTAILNVLNKREVVKKQTILEGFTEYAVA